MPRGRASGVAISLAVDQVFSESVGERRGMTERTASFHRINLTISSFRRNAPRSLSFSRSFTVWRKMPLYQSSSSTRSADDFDALARRRSAWG